MYHEDPRLFKAAEEDFKSIFFIIPKIHCKSNNCQLFPFLSPNPCHSIVVDLPPKERLDDLASLLQLDSKKMDVRKLGLDAIKEQQRINLKFNSNQTAILPEDKIQIMLAGVSNQLSYSFLTFECDVFPNHFITLSNVFLITFFNFQSMQLLQYSGLLEMQAHYLHRDALHLQNAALCGTSNN